MDQTLQTTVCLDGQAVRRRREDQQLTQLYVAKVVGVTTDTISRWENNRYPSVKRENALRLAEALECPVETILQGEQGAYCSLPEEESRTGMVWPWWLAGLLLMLAGGYWLWSQQGGDQIRIHAERHLAAYAAPGSVVPVYVRLRVETSQTGFILREHFPPGWKLIEASPPASSLDNIEGTARWIVKGGEAPPSVSYLLRVDPQSAFEGQVDFSGEVVAKTNGRDPVPVVGDRLLPMGPFHWADRNGDEVVDDSELLQASDVVDEMKGVHLDWDLLETLWDAGRYRFEAEKHRFVPVPPEHARIDLPGK